MNKTSSSNNVVVIGGSAGMGLAVARSCVQRGAAVTITGRSEDKLRRALDSLESPRAQMRAFDASERRAVAAFAGSLGVVDHVVIAAGGVSGACMGPFLELDPEQLREGFERKFWLHFNCAQLLAPTIAAGGSMTFVTAISASLAMPGTAGLAAINGAVESLLRPLAKELAPRVRVNAVSPGVVDTEWWSFIPAGEARARTLNQVAASLPLGRVGRPADVAVVVQMLMEAEYVTGLVVPCDGGSHLG